MKQKSFNNAENTNAGLYIHIPFCLSKCSYCSFYSIKSVNLISAYLAALHKEILFYGGIFPPFDTIYIGGGTPSLLTVEQLADIFSAIHRTCTIDPQTEVTIEVNPGDVSKVYLQSLHSLGISRINIGIQSFSESILNMLGRRHSVKEAVAAINAARQAGFDNLGIDLIYGVGKQGLKKWENTLLKALSFRPEHLSCYQLSLAARTPLYKKYQSCKLSLPDEKKQLKFFLVTDSLLESSGYLHYEVSNFARSALFKSKHNMKYWQHAPYLGVGPAAHSFLNNKRWWNKASVRNYLVEIGRGKMPVENTETLSPDQLQLEALFLGLRSKTGINLNNYTARYGLDLLTEKKAIIDTLIKNKLLELHEGFLRPTTAGMAVADSLALI